MVVARLNVSIFFPIRRAPEITDKIKSSPSIKNILGTYPIQDSEAHKEEQIGSERLDLHTSLYYFVKYHHLGLKIWRLSDEYCTLELKI